MNTRGKKGATKTNRQRKVTMTANPTVEEIAELLKPPRWQAESKSWFVFWPVAIGVGCMIAGVISYILGYGSVGDTQIVVGGAIFILGIAPVIDPDNMRDLSRWRGLERIWYLVAWFLTAGSIGVGISLMKGPTPFVSFAGVLVLAAGIGVFHDWTREALPPYRKVPQVSKFEFTRIFKGTGTMLLVIGVFVWLFAPDRIRWAGIGLFAAGLLQLGFALATSMNTFESTKKAVAIRYNRWTISGRMWWIVGITLGLTLILGAFGLTDSPDIPIAIGLIVFGMVIFVVSAFLSVQELDEDDKSPKKDTKDKK